MAAPQTMKAIKAVVPGKAEVQDVSVPEVRDDWILVKVKYVALNPTDWKHLDIILISNSTIGCDYIGTVVKTEPNVKGDWKGGDCIASFSHGCNKCDITEGAFADLPWLGSVPADCWLLIYAGSTATGSIAIQFAKLSGAKVITTSSAKNKDFDYNDPDCAKKIREYTNDELYFVMHCFGRTTGTAVCANSISASGGQICTSIPGDEYPRTEDVRRNLLLAYKILGEPWDFFGPQPATVEDYEFGTRFWKLAARLFAEAKIKVHPPHVREGLKGVIGGLDEMRRGVVSASKLVYKI